MVGGFLGGPGGVPASFRRGGLRFGAFIAFVACIAFLKDTVEFAASVLIVIVVGIAAMPSAIRLLAHKVEKNILYPIPMYKMLKIISSSLVQAETSNVRPALVKDGNGGGDPCYVMEEHGNGLATVLVPWSPASFAGGIKVVATSQLQYLNCTIDEYSRSISLMGVGIADCLAKAAPTTNHSEK